MQACKPPQPAMLLPIYVPLISSVLLGYLYPAPFVGGSLVTFLFAAIGLFHIAHALTFLHRKYMCHYPPFVMGRKPFLGVVKDYYTNPNKYLEEKRKELGDIFSIYKMGTFTTFVFQPDDAEKVFDSRETVMSFYQGFYPEAGFAFPHASKDEPGDVLNPTFDSCYRDDVTGTSLLKTIASALRPIHLRRYCPNLLDTLLNHVFPRLSADLSGTVDLFQWCESLIFLCTFRLLIGDVVLEEKEWKEIQKIFHNINPERAFLNMNDVLGAKIEFKRYGELKVYKAWYEKFVPMITDLEREYKQDKDSFKTDSVLRVWIADWCESSRNGIVPKKRVARDLFLFLMGALTNTFSATAWSVFYLYTNHDQLDLVKKQLSSIFPTKESVDTMTMEQVEKLTLIDDVVEECSRLRSPGITTRMVLKPIQCRGYDLPIGENVGFAKKTIQRDPLMFRDVDKFDITRFDNERETENAKMVSAFGRGAHPCTGKRFALLEIRMMLAILIQKFDFQILDKHPVNLPTQVRLFGRPINDIKCKVSLL